MKDMNIKNPDLKQWLIDMKARIHQSHIKAMEKLSVEILRLYWNLGRDLNKDKHC